jgi:periplasmic divalent cation tolerance protein
MGDVDFIVVLVTVGSLEEAEAIAGTLVGDGLAACVNRVGPVRSVYQWKGQVVGEDEYLLLIKARRRGFGALEARIRSLHSYEVPEVIAVPITDGSAAYLSWLGSATRERPPGA